MVIEGLRTPGDKSATLPTFSFSAHAMGDRVETLGEDAAALMLVPLKNTSGELLSSAILASKFQRKKKEWKEKNKKGRKETGDGKGGGKSVDEHVWRERQHLSFRPNLV